MKAECRQCGQCCKNNGFVPPRLFDDERDDDWPEWLVVLASRLKTFFVGDDALNYPCVFLTDDMRCAVHNVCKPVICRDFTCEETNTTEQLKADN